MDQRKLLALFAAISLLAGCSLMMILYPFMKGKDIFHPEPSPEDIGNSFLSALRDDDYRAAYNLCDLSLQTELVSQANMQYEIERYQIQPVSWEFISSSISKDQVELIGTAAFRQQSNGKFRLTLRWYEDGWKIAIFFLDY
jgi:hypothetical protein